MCYMKCRIPDRMSFALSADSFAQPTKSNVSLIKANPEERERKRKEGRATTSEQEKAREGGRSRSEGRSKTGRERQTGCKLNGSAYMSFFIRTGKIGVRRRPTNNTNGHTRRVPGLGVRMRLRP